MILETQNLRKYFGEVHAVDNVNFKVKEEEIVAIIGPNGAGKTTLVNVITGYLKPDGGKIIFMGKDITNASIYERIRAGIVRSFQLVNIFEGLSAFDNIRVAINSRERKEGKIFSLIDRDTTVTKEALQILDLFGLPKDTLARDLPHGDRKLLDVATAFALKPKLLLLDEPTSGVSTREKNKIMDVIIPAARKEKVSLVVIEHDMDIVFNYSDRIVVMHQGKILFEGKPDEVREHTEVKRVLLVG
ncbi:MAG: ABC transporter ATP-binding protein [Nitrososphaerales archaeon]